MNNTIIQSHRPLRGRIELPVELTNWHTYPDRHYYESLDEYVLRIACAVGCEQSTIRYVQVSQYAGFILNTWQFLFTLQSDQRIEISIPNEIIHSADYATIRDTLAQKLDVALETL